MMLPLDCWTEYIYISTYMKWECVLFPEKNAEKNGTIHIRQMSWRAAELHENYGWYSERRTPHAITVLANVQSNT